MNKLEFYKPQKSGNGSCITFQYSEVKDSKKKSGFYINIVKQHSWNESTRTGSFRENVNNPEKHKKIKLNEIELSNMVLILESNGTNKFSTVHRNGDNSTPFFFEPYIKDNVFVGHLVKVSNLSIALNMAESIALREYCKSALVNIFNNEIVESTENNG